MAHTSVEAVFLDAYGTLLSLDDPVGAIAAALAGIGAPNPRRAVEAAFRAEVVTYLAGQDGASDPSRLGALRQRCAAVLCEALPNPPSVADAREILTTRLPYTLDPDARALLSAMRRAGRRVAVVSNWDCGLREVLAGLDIVDLIDAVVVSAEVGRRKPDPEIFLVAARAVGVSPERILHCGDTPHTDCAGASAAGLRPVLLARDGRAHGDWETIPRLSGLAALIDG